MSIFLRWCAIYNAFPCLSFYHLTPGICTTIRTDSWDAINMGCIGALRLLITWQEAGV